MSAPIAEKITKQLDYHGEPYSDDYYWLRERNSEKVIDYLKAENAFTDHILQPTEKLQEKLYQEIKGRIKEDDSSVPVFDDGYFYYSRTEEGKQYEIHCRKKGSLEADEEILLDENELAEGKEYFNLGDLVVAPNNTLIAFLTDENGSESYSLFVKDLVSGEISSQGVTEAYYGLEWGNDSEHLFYTKFDHTHRPYQVLRHKLNTNAVKDKVVYQEDDEAFFLGID